MYIYDLYPASLSKGGHPNPNGSDQAQAYCPNPAPRRIPKSASYKSGPGSQSPSSLDSKPSSPPICSPSPRLNSPLSPVSAADPLFLTNLGANAIYDTCRRVVDTSVWPELKSYDDTGLAAVPSGWKGVCEEGTNFNSSNCNRNLIGARFFYKWYEATIGPIEVKTESKSPRDNDGHGTHTSSTATGTAVSGASLFSYASGTERGMAPQARLAMYKACWLGGCFSSNITAAMENVVEDGVDVLSLSIGGSQSDYYRDIVAIGAFSAAA
ncbi:hypothetical protein ACFX2B_001345 [Malus domestica]